MGRVDGIDGIYVEKGSFMENRNMVIKYVEKLVCQVIERLEFTLHRTCIVLRLAG